MTLQPARIAPEPARVTRVETGGPLDYEALRARGYTEPEARALLRAHGVRILRKLRISRELLESIERGDVRP